MSEDLSLLKFIIDFVVLTVVGLLVRGDTSDVWLSVLLDFVSVSVLCSPSVCMDILVTFR